MTTIEEAMAALDPRIRKRLSNGAGFKTTYQPTPSFGLNRALLGGLPMGRQVWQIQDALPTASPTNLSAKSAASSPEAARPHPERQRTRRTQIFREAPTRCTYPSRHP